VRTGLISVFHTSNTSDLWRCLWPLACGLWLVAFGLWPCLCHALSKGRVNDMIRLISTLAAESSPSYSNRCLVYAHLVNISFICTVTMSSVNLSTLGLQRSCVLTPYQWLCFGYLLDTSLVHFVSNLDKRHRGQDISSPKLLSSRETCKSVSEHIFGPELTACDAMDHCITHAALRHTVL